MQLPFEEFIKLLFREAYRYRGLIVGLFVIISLSAVSVGLVWPKTYQSSTTIFVEQRSVIQPLMQGGAAVATNVKDRSKIAKEVIFSRKVMAEVLEHGGWLENNPSEIEQDRIAEAVKRRTRVVNLSGNLIKIEYKDANADRAFKTAEKFADMLLSESAGTQASDSAEAFEFIDKQTKEYHEKLVKAEQQLKEFRSKNVDARPGTEAEITTKINTLQQNIEDTTLKLKEAQIRRASIEKQLAGEAEITASMTREGQLVSRIAELQSQLDTLRLTYHDTYPDIVRVKQQIADLKMAIKEESQKREQARREAKQRGTSYIDEGVKINPLYQQLRGELSQAKTEIASLEARISETRKLLHAELERAKRVYGGEATLVELTRDYEVNRDIYQDLLRRREKARVSMNIDREQSGLKLKIQEPAALPLRPSGIRFLHFVLGGLVLGILVPLALVAAIQLVDPRIRYPLLISEKLNLPVLATVPHLYTPEEAKLTLRNVQILGAVIIINLGAIVAVAFLKQAGIM